MATTPTATGRSRSLHPAGPRPIRRLSMASDSSESTTPEREIYDDGDSIMEHANDSQSSLGVSLDEMDLDRANSAAQEAQWQASPISRLPPEILISVFSRLSSPSDLRSCMLVSKLWAKNSVDLLWHRPDTRDWKNLLLVVKTARTRCGTFAYHDLIKRLNLAQLGDAVSDGTLHPIAACNRIERLTLTNCRMLTDLSVAALIQGNRSLLAIDVSGLDRITDQSLMAVAANCYKLQGLNVTKCSLITDESLVAIARSCRRVKRIKFNDCAQLTDMSILAFADNCHDLLEIDCCGLVNLTDISVTQLIAQGRQLRELRLQHCANITDNAFLELPPDTTYENLRILDLTDCELLQDAGLEKIVNAAPRLRNLVLAKCRQITDRGLTSVTRLGKNLHYCHLGHCNRITDYGVITLIRHCNRIRYIDLACCQHLTDASVSMLAILPKLKRIGLVKCQLITDESIKALAAHRVHGPNMLERLHLSYCTLLTVDGVRRMLLNCLRLTHLSLTGVTEFLQAEYTQFCREAPPEFTDHQREMFCVYSGDGVSQLREFLRLSDPARRAYQHQGDPGAAVQVPTNPPPGPPAGFLTRLFHDHQNQQPAQSQQHQQHVAPGFQHPLLTTPAGLDGRTYQLHPHGLPRTLNEMMANGAALNQNVQAHFPGVHANQPPPPPPAHLFAPHAQMPNGVVAVADDDEDLDEDMTNDNE